MGSRTGGGEWTGGVTGADAEAENETGPPESSPIPPRSAGAPVKLLGQSDGTIDSYNLEKPKRVNPSQSREFDECMESAKVPGHLQNIANNRGKCALRDDAIMHALEIEMSRSPNEEPTYPTTECSKEDTSSIQGRRKTKMKIISFVTPILKENHKRDNSSLSQLDERAMKCQALESDALSQLDEGSMKCRALESDAVELDARVEGGVANPTELENNIRVYDVEMSAYGNYKGHGLPLAFLMSKSTRRPIKGYPVTVEVLEDSCPAPGTEVHRPAVSCFSCLMESRISVPRQARSLRKPSCSRKILEHDLDKSSGPSTWRLSSHCDLSRKSLRERSNKKPEVTEDSPPLIHAASKPASSPRQTRSFPSFAKMLQVRV